MSGIITICFAAYKLACIGLNNPAYLNLRTVFEGITQMYLLHFTDREAYIFYRQQLGTLTEDGRKRVEKQTSLAQTIKNT